MNKLFPLTLLVLFISPLLEAGESRNPNLADRYYDSDNYGQAYELYQHMILREDPDKLSADTFYRYGYSYEQTRGLDGTALKIYALSRCWYGKEGRADSKYALYAEAKLAGRGSFGEFNDETAAAILTELRDSINRERKAYFYGGADWIYSIFSRFSLFQWKIILSLAVLIPFFIGILILGLRGRGSRS
ncbi:MAG: hypothetical protein LBL19_02510 [Spirochaetaceae bacterium]|jgi:hypothetical protein|nr:hypothetical protein [Spirochaetaceae bacterium]